MHSAKREMYENDTKTEVLTP